MSIALQSTEKKQVRCRGAVHLEEPVMRLQGFCVRTSLLHDARLVLECPSGDLPATTLLHASGGCPGEDERPLQGRRPMPAISVLFTFQIFLN